MMIDMYLCLFNDYDLNFQVSDNDNGLSEITITIQDDGGTTVDYLDDEKHYWTAEKRLEKCPIHTIIPEEIRFGSDYENIIDFMYSFLLIRN